jgi:hypothetical protein
LDIAPVSAEPLPPACVLSPIPGRLRSVLSERELTAAAGWVLGRNDNGQMITAAPLLYPHMWSWDTGFISVGLAHLSVERSGRELETLFAAQWTDGMVPHIVFSNSGGYFPDPQRWGAHELSPHAPASPKTSGICQPPVHAIALHSVLQTARAARRSERRHAEQLVVRLWPKLFRWHEWLVTHRDPIGTGLLSIVHSWESGMDNSERWDGPYRAVRPSPDMPPFVRLDRDLVADGAQRPSDLEYQRYLWLIEQMRAVRYDADEVVRTSSFLVADVFLTAVFVAACEVLAELGEEFGQPSEQVELLRAWARRSAGSLVETVDPHYGLARDRDLRTGGWLATRTFAGFAPLLCGGLSPADEKAMLAVFDGPQWVGHPGLFARVPPSTSPRDPGFRTREYWRGPVWPVITWLFWWAFRRRGWLDRAAVLRAESLRVLADGAFSEYYHPFTGEPLGSRHQSWTAAVTLDWLANP